MWQCPNCDEQHSDEFDTCWKCGSDPAGNRRPDFAVTEPVREEDQAPDVPSDAARPELVLPSITYFSIPPFVWAPLYMDFERIPRSAPDFSPPSFAEILVAIAGTLLIGVPGIFTLLPAWKVVFIQQRGPFEPLSELLWILSTFRLPQSLHGQYRWFAVIYYLSLAAMLIGPFAIFAWRTV